MVVARLGCWNGRNGAEVSEWGERREFLEVSDCWELIEWVELSELGRRKMGWAGPGTLIAEPYIVLGEFTPIGAAVFSLLAKTMQESCKMSDM